jgi:hypothetical protein
VPDGDFGAILELVTYDYEALIPAFTSVLGEEGVRLGGTATSLLETARDFQETDARVAQEFGIGKAITDDLRADGFYDVAGVLPVGAPSCDTAALPEVSFGFVLDKICDLTEWIVGIDPREYVTRWIAGDIAKAALQASAWQHVSDCLDKVSGNLVHGQSTISRTWTGGAAISSSYIPVWGQWKAVKTIKEGWELFKTARKAIMAFWQIVTTIKNLIISLVHAVTIESLPDAPRVPA